MQLHAIGFGALNLDEFWEVPDGFVDSLGLVPGAEYVRDLEWFHEIYPVLGTIGTSKAVDPGGSAANMIAVLHRMGFATGFYGATGQADAEQLRLHELGKAEFLRIQRASSPAGRCLSLVEGTGRSRDRTLIVFPNANDLAAQHVPDMGYFHQARWVHMTSFVSPQVLAAQTRVARDLERPTLLSFDPGEVYCRLGIEVLRPVLERAAVLFITGEEMHALHPHRSKETAGQALLEIGVGTVVVKLGAEGLLAFEADRTIQQQAVAPSVIRDRTGAGDVAAAGFLAGRLSSLDLCNCLEFAAVCAAKSIEGYGRSAYPDRALLEQYLADVPTNGA